VDGETGLLIGDASPEALADALVAILGDPARARAMGAAGRERAATEFSPDRSVTIVEAVYRRLVGA
jgi:glycosyltransferase involved in cell wall biosynthesis